MRFTFLRNLPKCGIRERNESCTKVCSSSCLWTGPYWHAHLRELITDTSFPLKALGNVPKLLEYQVFFGNYNVNLGG